MKIQVLGTGCERCEKLYRNVLEAVKSLGAGDSIVVEKIGDPEIFLKHKVFITPALVVDEQVLTKGKLLQPEEIESALRAIQEGTSA